MTALHSDSLQGLSDPSSGVRQSGATPLPDVNVNGASLIVFFNDGIAANNRDVVLFEGNDSNIPNIYDADGWNATLSGINYTSGSASIQLHVADGQAFSDDALVLNATTLVPIGPIFDGVSVPGAGFDASGNLWDIKSYDVTSFLSVGPNSLALTSGQAGDCLSLVVAAIDLPVGAAPPVGNLPPVITAPATHSGVYSDPITPFGISATDPDAADTVSLSATGLPSALGLVDNLDRTGTVSGTPTVAAGLYTASWTANDGNNPAVTGTTDITIAREDCTLSYSGDTLVAPLANTTLTAQLGESDLSLGDRSGKSVVFSLTDASANVTDYPVVTNATGLATTSVPLASNVYGVAVSFAGDSYYNPCSGPGDIVLTVQAAGSKVTGGGWVSAPSRTNFGFNLIPQAGGLWKGQIQVRNNNGKAKFHGNAVTSVTVLGPKSVKWTGTGSWNGVTGYSFEVTVVDNGSSGSKKGDTVSIIIKNISTNATVFTSGAAQALKGGNITVH